MSYKNFNLKGGSIMGTKKTPEIVQQLEKIRASVNAFFAEAEQDSQAAWRRARAESRNLEKLLKEYRKISVVRK